MSQGSYDVIHRTGPNVSISTSLSSTTSTQILFPIIWAS